MLTESAKGAIMGIVSTAIPEDEGMKKDSPPYTNNIKLVNIPLFMPAVTLLA